jgi:hypothetical protein
MNMRRADSNSPCGCSVYKLNEIDYDPSREHLISFVRAEILEFKNQHK